MDEPNLTKAVDVSARATWDRLKQKRDDEIQFDDLPVLMKQQLRQQALEWIFPAAQDIFEQGKRAKMAELFQVDAIHEWYFEED